MMRDARAKGNEEAEKTWAGDSLKRNHALTAASNRRMADRLDAEARELDELRQMRSTLEEYRQRAVESARQATEHVIARLPQAEGVRRSTLDALRKIPLEDSG